MRAALQIIGAAAKDWDDVEGADDSDQNDFLVGRTIEKSVGQTKVSYFAKEDDVIKAKFPHCAPCNIWLCTGNRTQPRR